MRQKQIDNILTQVRTFALGWTVEDGPYKGDKNEGKGLHHLVLLRKYKGNQVKCRWLWLPNTIHGVEKIGGYVSLALQEHPPDAVALLQDVSGWEMELSEEQVRGLQSNTLVIPEGPRTNAREQILCVLMGKGLHEVYHCDVFREPVILGGRIESTTSFVRVNVAVHDPFIQGMIKVVETYFG